jgi:hypothetical protein
MVGKPNILKIEQKIGKTDWELSNYMKNGKRKLD